jgi:hypothetical protein
MSLDDSISKMCDLYHLCELVEHQMELQDLHESDDTQQLVEVQDVLDEDLEHERKLIDSKQCDWSQLFESL